MKKIIASLIATVAIVLPSHSDPLQDKDFNTMHSMGCMLLRECTKNVHKVESIATIADAYPNSSYDSITSEFHRMLVSLEQVRVNVFLADQKYFPVGHRGVYHTVGNNFFLNKAFMHRPHVLMSVMRHEGWHAAQDCMAGTINNSFIAVIKPEEEVPKFWRNMAERTYPKSAVKWEAEAKWAGKTEGMTAAALSACARGRMWEVYEPTPLTRKYLIDKGFINK